ncbi:MAG TPA: response regulator [Candidatus Sumerlaeota bacterium]|nr:MAG: Transcriptional regulatory protein ZraR [candidate division BRC1 bacterium ADurb.BinA292]HOE95421.1 response regulator [Candidatus Sumerlaeota bacterium]HOR29193.1 response regulator [Candidatus Sumerlaeota bacterium]HPK02916.1 response regulator [Candidatus Sumerlaeota bacterium]
MGAEIQILVIDDDPSLLAVLETGLQLEPGYHIRAEPRAADGLAALRAQPFDLVVTDYSLDDPQINGLTILQTAHALAPAPLVVIITAFASLELTLKSIQLGAHDFLTKPFQLEELRLVVRNAARLIELRRENERLHEQVGALDRAMRRIERAHAELVHRLDQLNDDATGNSGTDPGLTPASFQALELRRRRMRDQIAVYARMGHEIGEQLLAERSRLGVQFTTGQPDESEQVACSPGD